MSDHGAGFPEIPPPDPTAETVESAPEAPWEPVNPPPAGGPIPPPPPVSPPPAAGYPPAGAYPPPGYTPGYVSPPAPSLSSNGAATLSYITFIPAVIFLLIEPYRRDPFVKFHAWQCIVLTAVSVVARVIFLLMGWIGFLVYGLFSVILFVFWLIALINANKGQRYAIPVVGDIAANLARSV